MAETKYVEADSEAEAAEHGVVVGYTPPHPSGPGFYSVIPNGGE